EAVPTLDAGVPKAVIPVGEQLRGLVADEYVAAGFGVATLVAHHAGQVGIAHPPGAVEGHAGVGAIHLGAGDVDVSVDFASGDGGAHDRLAPWHVDASGDLVLVVLGVGVPVALVFTLDAGGADPGGASAGAGKLRQTIGQHAGGVERTFHREGAGRAMHLPGEAGERVLPGVHRRTERTHDVIADAPAAVHQTGVDGRQGGVELACPVNHGLRGTCKAGSRGAAGAGQVGNDFLAGVVQVCGPEEAGGVVRVGELPLNAAGLDQRVPPGLDVV